MTSVIWKPPEQPECNPTCPADYIHACGHRFVATRRRGYLSITALPELTGYPWDEIALSYVQGLRPSSLRVVKAEETTNAELWRVTVYLDDQDKIKEIMQEVEVGLPPEINCGAELRASISAKS